ncbi:ATP-binding cassette domain-containing protein [Vibrio sp. SCSIO 43136]|uniref:ATP-binding cassette domain-containing protein n=1 Tax=Vibrio sp. SCSIO 43136 TaxID=2819101 RepID=UPI00207657F8|nr:ATP-binding cassette domain-containing protein [Vibrio sp. SCSIO 43136]USD63958.1 ATP-binding cassette domain-containing protein [Vibrio sp. SCSIO 43136]
MSLSLNNVTIKKHPDITLFDTLNVEVKKGTILTLMGPSGCGKSTLLDAIAGHLDDPFTMQGTISLDGIRIDQIAPHQRQVGILFQDDLLFPHLNVWQNLAYALPNQVKGAAREQEAKQALKAISLSNLAESYPDEISGGQRARISLTRMLLAKPKLALLDEPFSKLDKNLRSQFRLWVEKQLQEANIPALLVTHDHDDIADPNLVLEWPWS